MTQMALIDHPSSFVVRPWPLVEIIGVRLLELMVWHGLLGRQHIDFALVTILRCHVTHLAHTRWLVWMVLGRRHHCRLEFTRRSIALHQ